MPVKHRSADLLIAAALGLVTLLSRVPFQATLLNNFDAINYALALDHYDMRLAQPQAPGYPLYIVLGRGFNLFLRIFSGASDPRVALTWLSMLSSGLAVGVIYMAGRAVFNRRTGFFAALLLATSTVVWYMGEVAAPYTLDLFSSLAVGWLCYQLMNRSPSTGAPLRPSTIVWATAIAVGLAGALRLQTLVFLFPLFLYALMRGALFSDAPVASRTARWNWKEVTGGVAVAGMVVSAFFLPAVLLSGGFSAFVRSMVILVPIFQDMDTLIRTTRWIRFARNAAGIAQYTVRIIGELALPFLLLGLFTQVQAIRLHRDRRLLFLLIWLLPSWVAYFLVWPGNLGTMLVSVPPLFLFAAVGLDWMIGRKRWISVTGWVALVVLLIWSVSVFTILPEAPFQSAYRRFENYAQIQRTSDRYRTKLALVREFPSTGTLVYADSFRPMQYYLPQYRTSTYPRFEKDAPGVVRLVVSVENGKMQTFRNVRASSLVTPGIERIILFDKPGALIIDSRLFVEERSVDGYGIEVVFIPENSPVQWMQDGEALILREAK